MSHSGRFLLGEGHLNRSDLLQPHWAFAPPQRLGKYGVRSLFFGSHPLDTVDEPSFVRLKRELGQEA